MKFFQKILLILLCILLGTGCAGKNQGSKKGVNTTNTVDKVIKDQISKEDGITEKSQETQSNVDSKDTVNETKDKDKVDYDLTEMDSDMIYATVYQMMASPKEYEGKMFRIEGNFYAAYDKASKKHYFYCVIQDATACCAQGIEFVWGDGSHVYPSEYPKENAKIVVEGVFGTYKEKGDDNLYCRLSDASLKRKNR